MRQSIYSLRRSTPDWVKTTLNPSILRLRQVNWQNRCLPDFIVIGAQKSGTTSLHSYLSQHPQLTAGYKKEIHFFDGGLDPKVDSYQKGQAWYRSHFPLGQDSGDTSKTFEASPLYIFNPLVPRRMAELIPDVKLVAVLRNPVERAISHYFHEKKRNMEPLPVLEAFQSEEKRLEPIIAQQDYKNDLFIHNTYVSRGHYYEQLQRYLEYFSLDNILIMDSTLLFTQPNEALRRVFEFVGVDAGFTIGDLKPRNVASNKTKVDAEVYEYLEDYFRPHNQKLYDLIGEDFGW